MATLPFPPRAAYNSMAFQDPNGPYSDAQQNAADAYGDIVRARMTNDRLSGRSQSEPFTAMMGNTSTGPLSNTYYSASANALTNVANRPFSADANNFADSNITRARSELGMRSNETSGIAIERRQNEGNMATLHFGDNCNKSITHVGRILLSARKSVYDTARVVGYIDKTGEHKQAGINGAMVQGQEQTFDIVNGEFDARVTTGPASITMKQESSKFMSELVRSNPEILPMVGDVMFENSDVNGASILADRFKKQLDPMFKEDEQDPEAVQMKAALEQMQGVIQQLQQALESKEAEEKLKQDELMLKVKAEETKRFIEVGKLELERDKFEKESQLKDQEMALKAHESLKLDDKEEKTQQEGTDYE